MYRNSVLGTIFLQATHLLELAHTVPYGAHECGEQQVAQLSQTWVWQDRQGSPGGWQPPSAIGGKKPVCAQASHCGVETRCLGLCGV